MNDAPVNALDVNDSNVIWSWYGSGTVNITTSGELAVGLTLEGDADIILASDAIGAMQVFPTGAVEPIQITTTGEAIYGRAGEGSSQIQVTSSGAGVRWVLGQSASDIVLLSSGDAQVVQLASASFDIEILSELEDYATAVIFGEGRSAIELATDLIEHNARAIWLEGVPACLELASIAEAFLHIKSPAGAGSVALQATGEARFAERVKPEFLPSVIELHAVGELDALHYVYAEGASAIILEASALTAGIPTTPSEYHAAPRGRTITVQKDARALQVPRQNRRI